MSEYEQIAESLASSYLNANGVRSCQFVIKFKKLTKDLRDLVNVKLVEKGFPYFDPDAKPKKPSSRAEHIKSTSRSPLTTEEKDQKDQEKKILDILNEVQIDKKHLEQFLSDITTVEQHYLKQLAELKGEVFKSTAIDPFLSIYEPAHNHATHNISEISLSQKCGCFFCRATFDPRAITEFADQGQTALCPNCGIDAVIGDKAGYELSDKFLVAMFKRWFSVPIRLRAARSVPTVISQLAAPAPDAPKPAEVALPNHLEQDVAVGIGTRLASSLADDDDEELDD
jgi:hypothetical protein